MILQALVDYYESLADQGKISRPGWSKVKVSWALELDETGQLIGAFPLEHPSENGKKMLPQELVLPAPVKKTSGVSANFLYDHSSYILGLDNKGKPKRSAECFATSASLHQQILSETDSPAAKALLAFFKSWTPERAESCPVFQQHKEALLSGANLTWMYEGVLLAEYPEIKEAWQRHYDRSEEGDAQVCLITGKIAAPERVHPSIKNVRGAQSSGAAIVSFNAQAYWSYGKEQSFNAPIGKYAAFAYTTALNALLADRDHVKQIGDATVVYWTKSAEEQYQDAFGFLLEGSDDELGDRDLNGLMTAVAEGKEYLFDNLPLDPQNDFFILGLSPNAARISIRFFYRSSFGDIVRNLKRHYDDIRIVSDNRNKYRSMPLWALLRETVNTKATDKSPLPQMSGDVMKSMLSGGRYPETLVNQVLLRIRAEHDVTRGRAGILKAWLIRNTNTLPEWEQIKEVATVSLNEESSYAPYVLGRLFAVLEGLQQAANPGINATIKDRFFNSAAATPAAVFPILLKLSNSHSKKLDGGKAVYWSRQIGELTAKMSDAFPAHLSLPEQGSFILGYYHQTQKRFEKKTPDKED